MLEFTTKNFDCMYDRLERALDRYDRLEDIKAPIQIMDNEVTNISKIVRWFYGAFEHGIRLNDEFFDAFKGMMEKVLTLPSTMEILYNRMTDEKDTEENREYWKEKFFEIAMEVAMEDGEEKEEKEES